MTGCSSAGKIGASEIYRITNVSMVSMRGGLQADEEKVAEVKKLLTCGAYYFSWSSNEQETPIDLTLTSQKAVFSKGKTDNRFFWWEFFIQRSSGQNLI